MERLLRSALPTCCTCCEESSGSSVVATISVEDTIAPTADDVSDKSRLQQKGQLQLAWDEQPSRPVISEFTVTLQALEACSLGIRVGLPEGPYLRLSRISRKGLVVQHNLCASKETCVQAGDFVMAVNSLAGDADAMMHMLSKPGRLELLIRRPFVFVANLAKGRGMSLGLDLSYQTRSSSIMVKGVSEEGAAAAWNRLASPECQVRIHDHITRVNGNVGSSATSMIEALQDSDSPELLVARPAGDAQESGAR